jgi:hypothetical protein
MPAFRLIPLALATLPLLAAPANAATDPSAITVEFANPETFRDLGDRFAGGKVAYANLRALNVYLTGRAARLLAPGEQLRVTITEVDMAGEFELWRRGNRVRVVRDVYPPRIDLTFVLLDAQGTARAQGERKLRDSAFLFGASPVQTDPLRYEKALIDTWLEREFGAAAR